MIRIFKHYISRWSLLLFTMESAGFLSAVYAGVSIRFLEQTHPDELHSEVLLPRALFFAAVMVISMTATGRYQRLMDDGLSGELLNVALSFLIGLVAMSMLFYVFPDLFIGRGAFGFSLLFAYGIVVTVRWLFARFILDRNLLRRRVLVLGTGEGARLIDDWLKKEHPDITLVGYWPVNHVPRLVPEAAILEAGATTTLPGLVEAQSVNEIVVTVEGEMDENTASRLLDCRVLGTRILDLTSFFEQEQRIIHMDTLSPRWWVLQSEGLTQGTLRAVSKRVFDLLLSLVLLVTLWPVMLAAALAIWVEGRGREPVFYRQERVGFGGKVFHVFKFRSMRTDAEQDGTPRWAQQQDSRVTRVGRFIRYNRIDELPQFLNVFNGEMSLVGPRPERPEFVAILEQRIPYFRERLRVKPGITGWAQIRYGYGASEEDAVEKLKYDLYYVKNHNFFLDLLVLIHSVEVVLFGQRVSGPRVR
ncbi:MAG: TIGR03013 family PEP-CTERM/XrtA system glycosyltransferase [Magnetococcales bacterium]|nr:TIGR03013 family PEP-CTERM/XrtA system glycosyltransferase [Magnetococcales bacterium]